MVSRLPQEIPIVIISWNNLFFVSKFINQLTRFPNPIIVLDNCSTYQPLLSYLSELKNERITVHLLDQNYGHTVYRTLTHLLPRIYIISDPDLELHPDMPLNVSDQLLALSNKYKAGKIGLALDISDHDKFIEGSYGKLVYQIESGYYQTNVVDTDYTLYNAPTDTTFCLVNLDYPTDTQLRVGGIFTAKHLPWYNNYLRDNVPRDELEVWICNNKSSSILHYIDKESLLVSNIR